MRIFTFLFLLLTCASGFAQVTLPIDFETGTFTFGDFEGGVLTVEDNPDQTGINTSSKVAKMVKNMGAVFAGSSITLAGPIDFSVNKTFRMKVWSPRVGAKVLLKVESGSGAFFEKERLTTVNNEWESLDFDYSNVSTTESFDKIVLIFDNGTAGDGTANFTWYLDDIELVFVAVPPKPELPITFESDTINYDLTDFGGNASSIVEDPTNSNNMVAQAIRTAGSQSFAGTTMGNSGLKDPVPFTMSETKMNIRVWSPLADIPVRLKVEDAADPTRSVETEATTTVAEDWQTLEFDFSNEATGTAALNLGFTYNKVSIFFNFDATGVPEQTYYWDDVDFGGATTSVETLNAEAYGIKVTPNPASEFFQVELPESFTGEVNVDLYDQSGKLMRHAIIQGTRSQINVNDLNTGMYFMSLRTSDAVYYQKVMIAK